MPDAKVEFLEIGLEEAGQRLDNFLKRILGTSCKRIKLRNHFT